MVKLSYCDKLPCCSKLLSHFPLVQQWCLISTESYLVDPSFVMTSSDLHIEPLLQTRVGELLLFCSKVGDDLLTKGECCLSCMQG